MTINKYNIKDRSIDHRDVEGKPMGSGWKIVSIDKLAIDIFETKPLRGSSYIETPEKYSNAKCARINSKNEDEE